MSALLGTPLKDYMTARLMTARVLIVAVCPEWGDPTVRSAAAYVDRIDGQRITSRLQVPFRSLIADPPLRLFQQE